MVKIRLVVDNEGVVKILASVSEPIASITLKLELTNRNYQSKSWYESDSDRKMFKSALFGHHRKPFDFPVWIRVIRILGKRQSFWDSDSGLRGNSKELIDSLVEAGWFHDDNMQWIIDTRFAQDASQRKNGPAVSVEVYKA